MCVRCARLDKYSRRNWLSVSRSLYVCVRVFGSPDLHHCYVCALFLVFLHCRHAFSKSSGQSMDGCEKKTKNYEHEVARSHRVRRAKRIDVESKIHGTKIAFNRSIGMHIVVREFFKYFILFHV